LVSELAEDFGGGFAGFAGECGELFVGELYLRGSAERATVAGGLR
jgi:hypothetical protein